MDRFKFRVWSVEEKSYDHKFPFNSLGIFYIAETGRLFSDFGNSVAPEMHEDRFVVEQSTGLKDKNGNLIYEGDIVKNSLLGQKYTVNWDCDSVQFEATAKVNGYETEFSEIYGLYVNSAKELEIVGNIHEQKDNK